MESRRPACSGCVRRPVWLAAAVVAVASAAAAEAAAEAPTVLEVVPPSGDAAGGARVTVTGTGFVGVTSVTFGGVEAADVVVWTPLQLSCTVPPHWAGAVSVVVRASAGTNAANQLFTYTSQAPAPTVTGVSPAVGGTRGGVPVTLVGTGFSGAGGVTFDGVPAMDVVAVSDTELRCTTPPHAAGAASVIVTTPNGSNGANALFTYAGGTAPPTVTALEPARGPVAGGTIVTLEGTNFLGATSVTFGGEPATNVVVLSETELRCLTPAHRQGEVSVVVTTPAGSNGENELFTYVGSGWLVFRRALPPAPPPGPRHARREP